MPDARPLPPRAAAVIGAGPAGLMAAERLASAGVAVTVYERMPSPARKFLLAGRGGLNLTHSEPMEAFVRRYGAAPPAWLTAALAGFPPASLRAWAAELGEPTFTGSSGRVFPQGFKASPLLRAWLRRLDGLGVTLATRAEWRGWTADGALRIVTPGGELNPRPDVTVLAAGGASWPRMGSDGAWTGPLAAAGVTLAPFAPSNSGALIAWSAYFRERFAGQPLKRIALACGGESVRGEAVVTRGGLEGGAVYALSRAIRAALAADGAARLRLDLRPDLDGAELARRLSAPRGSRSGATWLRRAAGLAPVAVALLREADLGEGVDSLKLEPQALARRIRNLPLAVTGLAGLERAISSAGGVSAAAVDDMLMLRARPGVFVAGEMLDWDAPTGGYLLQACFALGARAAAGALAWLAARAGA